MVVFFDIDGTGMDYDTHIIPESAAEAIRLLKKNGHIPVVNTGRPLGHVDERIRELDFSGWICSCGAVNKGKFCVECGSKKPAGAPIYRCDKCGWKPADPTKMPKFCPECGDPFDENDIQ